MGILLLGAPSEIPFGKINLGLTQPVYNSGILYFLNLCKAASAEIFYANAGVTYSTAVEQGFINSFGTHSAYPLYADVNGESLAPLPAGTSGVTRIIWQQSGLQMMPPQMAGKSFTVDWTGGAGWTMVATASGGSLSTLGFVVSGSTFTFTWPSTLAEAKQIYLDMQPNGNLSTPPQNIRIYKTSGSGYAAGGLGGAARLAAGEIIDPDYADQIRQGCGTFRVMDWMQLINNGVTNSFDKIPTEASNFWGTIGSGASGLRGMPLSVITKLANAINKHPHFSFPSPMMCPKYKDVVSITKASSPVLTTLGPHTYANGDTVILNSIALSQLINPASYATSTFTCPAPHGMVNGYPLMLGTTNGQNPDGSTYPTGVSKAVPYYACNVASTTFQIASTQANALAGTNIALSGSIAGSITGLGSLVGGSAYTNGTYNNVPLTGGAGSGATANITVSGGAVTSVIIVGGGVPNGSGLILYAPGNTLSATAASIGGTGSGFSINITTTLINLYLNMNLNRYTVANTNPSANTFEITGPGSDTSILTSGTGLGGFSMMPYDAAWITTEVGKVVGYFRDNMPSRIVPTYELDNEIWNFGTRVFFNFNGQSRGKFSDNPYACYVYIQCLFAQAIKTAYGGDRSRYKMVFGGNQMFGDLFGAGLTAGWNAYVADNPGVIATDLFDYLLGNTYFQTSYNGNGSAVAATFGTNTIASSGARAGWPVKLATTGALPSGLVAGTLGTAAATPQSSYFLGTISGNVLTVTNNLGNGNTNGTILAGSAVVLPDVIPAGTTIAAYGTGGTTGTGGNGTYQISNSLTVSTLTQMWQGTPFTAGTGTIYWLVGTSPNFGLATTPGGSPLTFSGGSGTHTAARCPNDVVKFLVDQSLALHASTPGTYPTPYTYYNQAISDDLYDARWTAGNGGLAPLNLNFQYCIKAAIDSYNYYYTTYLAPTKLLAGLSQTSYEGGYNGPPQVGFLLKADPTWQAMFYSSNYSQGQADNMAQMDAGVRTVPNGFYKSSQFLDTNPFGIQQDSGTYGPKEYIGDNNLRWQGIVAVNNS